MYNKYSIRRFVRTLKRAAAGDLRGWTLDYELNNGLRRYRIKDAGGRMYDAYVYAGSVKIYDQDMKVIL